MDLYKAPLVGKYFAWLQQGNPVGLVEKYPVLSSTGETTLKGVYVAGDLTGIPLLKLAVDSGAKRIREWVGDPLFKVLPQSTYNDSNLFDVVIVGAGPSGLAAALECEKNSLNYIVIESHQIFNTIENFPKAKPILTHPSQLDVDSEIPLHDGVKEDLLQEWHHFFEQHPLKIKTGVKINKMKAIVDSSLGRLIELDTGIETFKASRVLLAIGKSGNSRKLGCLGENLPKVLNRLFDPAVYEGQNVAVIGGGDSAIEGVIALAQAGALVTHSYRKDEFARPKEENLNIWKKLVAEDKIKPLLGSQPTEVSESKIHFKMNKNMLVNGKETDQISVENEVVFSMIGRELPVQFFKNSQIQMEGEKRFSWWVHLVSMLSFFTMLYFGKKGVGVDLWDGKLTGLAGLFQNLKSILTFPAKIFGQNSSVNFEQSLAIIGWLGLIVFAISGTMSLVNMVKLRSKYFNSENGLFEKAWLLQLGSLIGLSMWIFLGNTHKIHWANQGVAQVGMWLTIVSIIGFVVVVVKNPAQVFEKMWNRIKYTYLIWSALFFTGLYGVEFLAQNTSWSEPSTYWYSFLYCTTMMLFGARRAHVKPTKYIRFQMLTVNLVQVIFLFLLPFHIYDWVLKGFEGTAFMNQVFPQGKWTSFGFILLWPLNMGQFGASTFWSIFPFIQTFGILWYIVHRFGKGGYCGWICSCGGMAESLGDEYRSLAPHGPTAKKWENLGQFVLLVAMILSVFKLMPITHGSDMYLILDRAYSVIVDVFFAGVLGLGVYFFMGGRIWCRFGCPLAALMHIQTRFSRYRIVADKKACISCNICTKVCHMGIDVMNFANKGIPMNDAECVRCSSCVESCPMDVLAFDELETFDPENTTRKSKPTQPKEWWGSGVK